MAFSPNIFLSNVVMHGGLAKTSRFRVIMNIPEGVTKYVSSSSFMSIMESLDGAVAGAVDSANSFVSNLMGGSSGSKVPRASSTAAKWLSMQCESTELPGRSLQTMPVDIYGPVYQRPYKTEYLEAPFTFVCTNDFYERRLFDTWMEAINPSDTHNLRYRKSQDGKEQYTTDIAIVQYDDFVKQIYAVKLIDAFPKSVAPMGLNWSDDGFHRLTVQFSYRKYEVIENLQYDFPDASAIFGAVGTRVLGGITL